MASTTELPTVRDAMPARALLVEDQALVRAGIKAMLLSIMSRCEVLEAGNVAEAVAWLDAAAVDIAFIDVDLRTDRSGLDLLHVIRMRGLATQVVMLSANDESSMVLKCIDAGASGYLVKGEGDERTLGSAIATVLAGGVHLPRSVLQAAPVRKASAATDLHARLAALPPRLREVLYHVCQGLTNKAIAARMGISEGTVRKDYVSELLRLFGVTRRTELMIEVYRSGLTIPAPQSGNDATH